MLRYVNKILIFLFITFVIVISAGPFLWVLISSLKTNAEIMNGSLGLPKVVKLGNYVTAFKIAPLAGFYMNSILVAISATILNIGLLSMAAYVLARTAFKARGFFKLMFAVGLLIPSASLLQPLYMTVKSVGLYDSLLALIIVYAAFGLPVTVYVMTSYFITIPKELEESAYLDGAGFFTTFVRIVMPVSKPALGTAAVLEFLLCWNEFQFALTLTTGNRSRTIPLALYYFKSQFASDYGAMFAATVLVTIPSVIVYILLQEQVVSGLTAGAVKA